MSHEPHDKLQSDADTPGPSRLVPVKDGPWAGWHHWEPVDFFEDYAGPFYCRPEGEGVVCGFLPETKNTNAGGAIHGGALMTFADYALFMIAGGMDGNLHGVTMTMNCDFVGAGEPERLLTARGEIVRDGLSVAFVRGLIDDDGRPVLGFSGTIKKFKPRG
jgi:acyl-coenzyme A thioesterase PaaI-like protein